MEELDELAGSLEATYRSDPRPEVQRFLDIDHVLQANRGADLDFLVGASGHEPPRHSH
jgi:hypothetical protein